MEPNERETPLRACPYTLCLRRKTCLKRASLNNCLITHHKNYAEWCDFMTKKLRRLRRGAKPDPERAHMSEDELMAIMYRALKDRLAEFDALAPSD